MTASRSMISVIIPAYNGATYIAEALASVRAQDYAPLEIIVVDDGSTDATAGIVRAAGDVRYAYQPNSGGPASARNRGIAMAQGAYVAFLDQDDLWPAGKLRTQALYLDEDPALEVVLGRMATWELVTDAAGERSFVPRGAPWAQLHVSSALFRRSVFERLGVFDPSIPFCADDYDWFLRAREANVRMRVIDDTTLIWRHHGRNTTVVQNLENRPLLHVLKRQLDRRRDGTGHLAPVPGFATYHNSAGAAGAQPQGEERV